MIENHKIVVKIDKKLTPSEIQKLESMSTKVFRFLTNSRIDGNPVFEYDIYNNRTLKIKNLRAKDVFETKVSGKSLGFVDIFDNTNEINEIETFSLPTPTEVFKRCMGFEVEISLIKMLEDHLLNPRFSSSGITYVVEGTKRPQERYNPFTLTRSLNNIRKRFKQNNIKSI